jgi:predicted phosphodiesterase
MERTALLYDVHVPYQDDAAYYMAIDYIRALKPKINRLILAGDFVDFKDISWFKNDPKRLSYEEEVNIAIDKLKELRKMFYRIPIDYIEGNHEERLWRYVRDKAPKLEPFNSVEKHLRLTRRRIKYHRNIQRICNGGQPYSLGKLFVLHGHEKKVSFNAVNLARLYYNKCKANVIAGHHHRTDFCLVRKLDGAHEGAWSVGTLGKLSEPYQPINDHNHGFAFVDVFDDDYFEVHNKIILEGRVLNG